MKITTLITLPEEVYQFYTKAASQHSNCTTEQLMADTLINYANSSTAEEYEQLNSSTSKSLNG